jgi:hypothetical protein
VHCYRVPVRNEHTGEVRIVEILSGYEVDAQLAALEELFRTEGWRKAVALRAEASFQEGEATA